MMQKTDALKEVRHILAVASGKGGVGKSTVAANLALALAKTGAQVGLLDCDIYGPSIPMMLAITERPTVIGEKVVPVEKWGLKILSMGMLATEDTPVIWRGPMVAGILQQFLFQVAWGRLDYLVMDLPPGTGDAQLTLSQIAPLSGAVIVTTPQDVALLDARRGLKMFQQVNVPVLGLVENMSYFVCDQCQKKHAIFKSKGAFRVAKELNLPLLAEIPIDPDVAEGGDSGNPIFISHPESEAALAYEKLARAVTTSLEKNVSEESLHLKW
ncbi:MAG: Mrp/NBP35 family ATP-binding protein [Deltaproteobacteria bacterium]|nr:Mrp/NBP35 family ATP-binding protein [Deltaproteobacteria bacterium]